MLNKGAKEGENSTKSNSVEINKGTKIGKFKLSGIRIMQAFGSDPDVAL